MTYKVTAPSVPTIIAPAVKRIITEEVVAQEVAAGRPRIWAPRSEAVVTPGAWSKARELGAVFEGLEHAPRRPAARDASAGSAERVQDAAGVIVVRGKSVVLGRFDGAGPDRDVRLLDLIGSAQGSPMAAGIMSFAREDAFPWTLGYDEIDLVLEGKLHVLIDGRTVEGQAGDVLFIPRGSAIVFSTPNRVRVFYVTHPADWASGARPGK
jgi:ethanolamine utilization protein EutQ (cupin superfamily)